MQPGDDVWARERKQAEALGWGFTLLETIDPRAAGLIPLHFQQQNGLLAFGSSQRDGLELLHVAVDGPAREDVVDELRFQMQRAVKLFLCPPSVLREGWAVAASGKGRGPTPAPMPATPLPPAHTPAPVGAQLPVAGAAPGRAGEEEVLEELELILEPEMIVEEAAPLAELVPEPLPAELSDGWSDELDAMPLPVEELAAIASPPPVSPEPVAVATTPEIPQRPASGKVPLPGATPLARVALGPATAQWHSAPGVASPAQAGAADVAGSTPGVVSPVPPPAGGGHSGGWSPVIPPARGETPVPSQAPDAGSGWSPGTPAGGARSLGIGSPEAGLASSSVPSWASAVTSTSQDATAPGAVHAPAPVPPPSAPFGADASDDMVDTDWAKELLPDGPPPPPPDAEPGSELVENELTPSVDSDPMAAAGSDLVDTDWAKDFLPEGPPPQAQTEAAQGGLDAALDAAFGWEEPGAPGSAVADVPVQGSPGTLPSADDVPLGAVIEATDTAEAVQTVEGGSKDTERAEADTVESSPEADLSPVDAAPLAADTAEPAPLTDAADVVVASVASDIAGAALLSDAASVGAVNVVADSTEAAPGADMAPMDAVNVVADSTEAAPGADVAPMDAVNVVADSTVAAPGADVAPMDAVNVVADTSVGAPGTPAPDSAASAGSVAVASAAENLAAATEAGASGLSFETDAQPLESDSQVHETASDPRSGPGLDEPEGGEAVDAVAASTFVSDVLVREASAAGNVAAEADTLAVGSGDAPTRIVASSGTDAAAADAEKLTASTDALPPDVESNGTDAVAIDEEKLTVSTDALPPDVASSGTDAAAADAETPTASTHAPPPDVESSGTDAVAADAEKLTASTDAPRSDGASSGTDADEVDAESLTASTDAPASDVESNGTDAVAVDAENLTVSADALPPDIAGSGTDADAVDAENLTVSADAPPPDVADSGADEVVAGAGTPATSADAPPSDVADSGADEVVAEPEVGPGPDDVARAGSAFPHEAEPQREGEGTPERHAASDARADEERNQALLTRESDDAASPGADALAHPLSSETHAQDAAQGGAGETFDTDWAKELLPDGPPPPPPEEVAARPDALRALAEGSSEQRFGFSPEELAILDGLERLAMGVDEEAAAEKVRPARMIASVVRLLLRKGLIDERELLDELSRS